MEAAIGVREGRSSSSSAPPWQLTDLISVETLQSIQDTFARAFGLPTVIVDTAAVNATAITHRLAFCEDMTRTSSVGGPRCAECDLCAMREAADSSRPAIFKCWNGLYDCAIPIAPKGHVLGYFLCGQILTTPPDPELYARTAEEIGVAPEQYVQALGDVKVVPHEQYVASVQSMGVLAEMIADQAAASIDSLEMLEEARRAKDATAQLVQELDTILEALRDIGSQPDYQATLASIADNLARLIPWDSCVIYLADDEHDDLVPVVVRDPYADQVAAYRPRKGQGILGTAALGGAGRRFLDITREPGFEPIPGVPVEPESALVMPMIYKGTVSGVICLSRFERRTFTDHDLRVLDVFSSQASVSIQVSRLASESAQRLGEERAFGRLRLAMAPRTKVESIMAEAAQVGLDLLTADSALVSASGPTMQATTVRLRIDEEAADALLGALAPAIRRATERGEWEVVEHGSGSALVLPLAPSTSAFAVFVRRRPGTWDARLITSLSAQASLGIEKARMHERERQLLLQYQRLSELGTELVGARDAEQVRERLMSRTPEILSADACFIASLDQGPDAIAVEVRRGARSEEQMIKLQGGARLAAVRLRDEAEPDPSVFDTWSREVFAAVAPAAGLTSWLAEPLPVAHGAVGGLFVGWRSPDVEPSPEQRRILRVLASSAGTALGRFAAHLATDSTLSDRLTELEALTNLARRISGLTRETPIVDELLASLCRVGRLDGAAYAAVTSSGPRVLRATGLQDELLTELSAVLGRLETISQHVRVELRDSGLQAVVVPLPGVSGRDVVLAGVGPRAQDDHRDRVMATLARYGAVALENAQLHDRQREAISRLERQQSETGDQYARLERILSVHETLALAVLEGRGLGSVVRSLSSFMDAEMLVVAPQERVLARWPPDCSIDWRPDGAVGEPPRTVAQRFGDADLVAAPAVVDGDTLAWIIARTTSPFGDVERAAVEYGALLVALELLRERTAIEVETRLRGGLLEELFSGTAVEDLVVRRALAFGYDLACPSRVFLVEAAPAAPGATTTPIEPETFYAPIADCARRWSAENLVALRGGAVVIVVPETPDARGDDDERFEDDLRAMLRLRLPALALNTAVGTRCERFEDYGASYLAARRGLHLLRLLGRPGDVFSFRVSSLESMLLQSTRPEVIVDFISRYVDPLDLYDSTHTSDLRRTLEVYFESGSTLEEAARRLHIHVSTLRYRLNKAAEVIDVDLKDGALDLQVALKAARVLGVRSD
jgi:ligand-binding sensor protein/sugar diacid utilization regulator/GAF domain-containing protein